jgi:pimeloyl-ACP methyl ester carboxylesterase
LPDVHLTALLARDCLRRRRTTTTTLPLMERIVTVGDLDFLVVEDGPADGRPVLLLHGFPDSSDLWRNQIPVLADAGYHVIAPDQRGFGRSAKPDGIEAYALPHLVGDMLGVLDALDVQRPSVVSHDWGAAIGWALASMVPDRVERLAALSVGHPSGYFAGSVEQLEKSWYMLWFVLPDVAEAGLSADGWSFLRRWSRHAPDAERWIAHFSADHPRNITSALNWYRANVDPGAFAGGAPLELPPVACPVLGVWSDGDAYCGEDQMHGSSKYVNGPWRYERINGSSHWIPVDAPERLNPLLLDFLG